MRTTHLVASCLRLLGTRGVYGRTAPTALPGADQTSRVTSRPRLCFEDSRFTGGLANPVSMAFAPDGRILVCEQGGRLRVIQNGTLLPEPFLSLNVDPAGERGLLGVALDPAFPQRALYLRLLHGHLARTSQPPEPLHRGRQPGGGGQRARTAGPGESGLRHQPQRRSPPLRPRWHALRERGRQRPSLERAVADQPVRQGAAARQERRDSLGQPLLPPSRREPARHLGARAAQPLQLRRCSQGPGASSSTMWGRPRGRRSTKARPAGTTGGRSREGPTSDSRFSAPLYAYQHAEGEVRGCAITGGVFYNPPQPQFPAEYVGKYFFADYCGGMDPHARPRDAGGRALRARAPMRPWIWTSDRTAPSTTWTGRRGSHPSHPLRGSGRAPLRPHPAGEPARGGRRACHLHGERHWHPAAELPVAAQWQRISRARPARASPSRGPRSRTLARASRCA